MHPDLLALLESVRANPADHLRRLVLADWLEEYGRTDAEHGRAELIRVQLELHRRPADDPDRVTLLAREKRLIAEHVVAWADGLPHQLTDSRINDRRFSVELGMIRPWFGRGQRWVADAASGNPVWAWVDGVTLIDVAVDELAELTNSSVLRRLNMLGVGPDGWSGWTNDEATGPEGARQIAESPHATELTELDLSDCVIGPVGTQALAGSPHLAGLTHLDLGGGDATPANLIRDEGARALAESPFLTRLEYLNLIECYITSVGAAALAASPNVAGLTHLHLMGNRIGALGLRALAESPFLTRLQFLSAGAAYYGRSLRSGDDPAELAEARELLRRRFGAAWHER